ncbi:unnamed protein product [Dibothriocephalus latus]|uniref:Uncharacterized protein n=1 Tax=Dibothriocephalus latus TaxID=60516 RepID=A0A3P6THL2_DIBLA|nr:unnamed protein product [Dibothriocephalus latus]
MAEGGKKAKGKGKAPKPGAKQDSPLVKLLKACLKEYDAKCIQFECSPCATIRDALRLGIDEEKPIYSFVMDPKDRRKVEYWNDKKFTKYFEEGGEEGLAARKKKKKKKVSKPEKPLVRLLPFIDTLRNHRYCQIKELLVWDVYVDHSDMMCLASMLTKGCYDMEMIELVDCFINQKALDVFAPSVNHTRTLSDLILDFNEFGDSGCQVLCEGLANCHWLIRLSLCFCDLHKQSGIWLGNLIAETSIRELFLDGNHLEAEGAIALLTQISEAAVNEGFERERAAQLKIEQAEAAKNGKTELPMEISHLHLAENGINHMGRGGNFAPVRCMQLIKEIIKNSKDLQEIDLFGNEIGQVGGRILLEGVLARIDNKLPKIGVRVSHLLNQDTYDAICKLAPGPKPKKKKNIRR